MKSGSQYALSAIWGTAPNQVIVGGSGGTILRFDGSAWTPLASGTSYAIVGLRGGSGSDVVAAGGYGILRYKP
jgi:hypothetical protein